MKVRAIWVAVLTVFSLLIMTLSGDATITVQNEKVIQDAMQNQDTDKLIKTLITSMKEQLEVDYDRYPELIKEVEVYVATVEDKATVALLHSMIAEMYNSYYQQNQWQINRRTNISGYVPDDMREWTANLFDEKIKEELSLSLQSTDLLQQTAITQYKNILTEGKDTRSLRPTLYDFLMWRTLDMKPSDEGYQALLDFRRSQNNRQATLMVELAYLKYQYGNRSAEVIQETYIPALDNLMNSYQSEAYSIEIAIDKSSLLERIRYNVNSQDSITTLLYNLYTENIARYPAYERTNVLKNQLSSLMQPMFEIQMDNTIYPGTPVALPANYKNLKQLKVQVYESKRALSELTYYGNSSRNNTRGRLVKEVAFALNPSTNYLTYDSVLQFPSLPLGLYEFVITAPAEGLSSSQWSSVSKLAAVFRESETKQTEVLVTDYQTGKPIPNAIVTWYGEQRRNLQRLGEVRTDNDGIALLPKDSKARAMNASLAGDTAMQLSMMYVADYPQMAEDQSATISLFTDRGLYRPGQNLFFKGIAYQLQKDKQQVIPNRTVKVVLRDANYKEVATKSFTTNEFGSFDGEFTLPQQGLNGYYILEADNFSVSFRVEEYKRPTFAVEFSPITSEVAFDDEVALQGKVQTFSGAALADGSVTWRVVRRPFWLRNYGRFNTEQVAEGQTTLSEGGAFSFSFIPRKEEVKAGLRDYYTYEVSAIITDSKGETQEGSLVFSVGDTGILLLTEMPEKIEKDSVSFVVQARTLNGESVSASGNYTIAALEDLIEKGERTGAFKEGRIVGRGEFTADKALDRSVFSALPSGRYRMHLESQDSKGRKVTAEQDLILYSKQDKQPPVYSSFWVLEEKTACLPGENAQFVIGTSEKDAYILYELYSNGKRTARSRIKLSNENRVFTLPFESSWGDGAVASFVFVKAGALHATNVTIRKKQPNKQLVVKPITFRDHLLPGSKENWQFRIWNADSAAVKAEVLAGMYDASLDKIAPFDWSFAPQRSVYLRAPGFTTGAGFRKNHGSDTKRVAYLKFSDFEYSDLDWQGMIYGGRFGAYGNANYMSGSARMMMKSASPDMELAEAEVLTIVEDMAVVQEESDAGGEIGAVDNQASPQIRQNFNETAFFYPTLCTNEAGDVLLNFVLPESNTTWKLQLVTHTADLYFGQLKQEIIASKPLMVLPNLPRFLRQGDQVTLSAQILNQSEDVLNGKVNLLFFDPETDLAIESLRPEEQSFHLDAKGSTVASWAFSVPEGLDLVGCRIVAEADGVSDGEQHLLPVLSDQILITESKPFFLFNEGEKQLTTGIDKPGRKPFRLTLEMTANPVWYAVQALPTLTQPEHDNVLSWFAVYYSNILSTHIANAHPRIQQVISQWMAQGGDATTLLSNLERNEELKNILLEETPWVLEAKNETDQKQRLSLLFDLNRSSYMYETALQRLLEQQNEDGGWSWYKGFYSDRTMTLSVLKGMSQLVELNAIQYGEQEKRMQMNALRFLDDAIRKDYEQLKKYNREWEKVRPTSGQISYLYVRSGYRDIPESVATREASRFYTEQAEKYWEDLSLADKAALAILLHRNGKRTMAAEIMTWFRRTATTSEEMGMYWANNRRGADYFTSPIDVHSLLMSAFKELGTNETEVNQMKQWLLSQKRTQNWESTPSTVNAIYAMLLSGTDWLSQNNVVTAQWNGDSYSTADGEVATGYLKEVLTAEEINPTAARITIRKEGTTPAWGAVYSQYFESLDKVSASKGVLNVEKKMFVEINNGEEIQIRPVTSEQPLRVGDKVIVRLTIRTDRDMDYVFLKDLRAGCFEPGQSLSGYRSADGVGFYQSPKDVAEHFFFARLPKGTFVVEYPVYVSRTGEYTAGISTIQCLYAPEFVSHTDGEKIVVAE